MTPAAGEEKRAFLLQLRPGMAEEYERRHQDIFPDLANYFLHQGVRDYSIHLDQESGLLFASQWRPRTRLPLRPKDVAALARWQEHMSDLLVGDGNGEPISRPLRLMFWRE